MKGGLSIAGILRGIALTLVVLFFLFPTLLLAGAEAAARALLP